MRRRPETESLRRYKRRLHRVVRRIDQWHQTTQERRQSRFERDEDYVECSPSPSNFSSSDGGSPFTSRRDTQDKSNSKSREFALNVFNSHHTGSDGKTTAYDSPARRRDHKLDLKQVNLSPVVRSGKHSLDEKSSYLDKVADKHKRRLKRKRSRTGILKTMTQIDEGECETTPKDAKN